MGKFHLKVQVKVAAQQTVQHFDLFTMTVDQFQQTNVLTQVHVPWFLITMVQIDWSVGRLVRILQKKSTNELMDNNDLSVNDRVSIRTSNMHTYETRTVDYINLEGIGALTDNYFTVSQPFTAAHAEKRIFLNFKGTTTSAACSGRGLCDGSSAECQCFKGYTGQACQIQNALAA